MTDPPLAADFTQAYAPLHALRNRDRINALQPCGPAAVDTP